MIHIYTHIIYRGSRFEERIYEHRKRCPEDLTQTRQGNSWRHFYFSRNFVLSMQTVITGYSHALTLINSIAVPLSVAQLLAVDIASYLLQD